MSKIKRLALESIRNRLNYSCPLPRIPEWVGGSSACNYSMPKVSSAISEIKTLALRANRCLTDVSKRCSEGTGQKYPVGSSEE